MIKIHILNKEDALWSKATEYIRNCSWEVGKYLAKMMEDNSFLEWERVFIAMDGEKIVGFCNLTAKDELPEGYEFTPFIGFVFVDENHRGKRISELLVNEASSYAKSIGYRKVYIMSGEKGFYEKYGFELIGEYETIYDWRDQLFVKDI